MLVYIELSIGDQERFRNEISKYEAGLKFVEQYTPWLKSVSEFSSEQLEELDGLKTQVLSVEELDSIRFEKPQVLKSGKLVFELFEDKCPKACQNFYHLCLGDKGFAKSSKKPLHYLGSEMFRLVPNFIIQGGDITRGDGSGGDSIYNGKFKDEKCGLLDFDSAGILAMANSGKNSNTSQFFITLNYDKDDSRFLKLNKNYVVIGKIVAGQDFLEKLGKLQTKNGSKDGKPELPVAITGCGKLDHL